jgi:putative ABC transport system permease protein
MTGIVSDLRLAVRTLTRRPVPSFAAIAILALAIGASTAMFSVLNSVALRPLPFSDPDRLVVVREQNATTGARDFGLSPPRLLEWREARSFVGLAAYTEGSVALSFAGEPEQVAMASVTANLFAVLGRSPALGRMFSASDEAPGAGPVAILGYALWRNRFGGTADVLGSRIELDGVMHEVVGVAPESLDFPAGAQVWTPLMPVLAEVLNARGARFLSCIGRLDGDVTLAQAGAELDAIAARVPENDSWSSELHTLLDATAGEVKPALQVLMGSVLLVLIIACANVGNLQLVGLVAREREAAIRSALGASRARLARLFLTESLTIALLGGALGLLLAFWGIEAIIAVSPVDLPRAASVRVDPSVAAFATLLSLSCGVLVGLVPLVRLARGARASGLKDTMTVTAVAGRERRLGDGLVVIEVALTLVLLTSASLLLRSYDQLLAVDPGFEPRRIATFDIMLPELRYAERAQQLAFIQSLTDRVSALPGVQAVGATRNLPVSGRNMSSPVVLEGAGEIARSNVQVSAVTPGYFAAMGIDMTAGRGFSDADDASTPPVALVNETLARTLVADGNTIGHRARTYFNAPVMKEIVGVVSDVRQLGRATLPPPTFYTSLAQEPARLFTLVVRSDIPPATLATTVRSVVLQLDSKQPVAAFATVEELLARDAARPRFHATLAGAFAMLAVVLAVLGLYAVLAAAVARQSRTIAIRMALGAVPAEVVQQTLRRGMVLVAIGITFGLAAAAGVTRLLGGLLFQISAADPLSFLGAAVLLILVSAAACALPARRAARTDPMLVLRE